MPALRLLTLGDRLWDRIVRLMLLCVCAILWPAAAWAQTSVDGMIQGVVRDSSGAVLHDAAVRVVDTATGTELAATRNSAGEFTIARASAGVYRITVTAPGFVPQELQAVVEVGGVTRLNVGLRIAEASTVVNVRADDIPDAAALSSSITPEEIARLPVNGREWQTFALLQPGVNASDEGESLLSFRGMAATQNSTSIDGVSGDQSFGAVPQGVGADGAGRPIISGTTISGGYERHAGAAYTFAQESVREFRIQGQNYSALYGHAAGGAITTISRSG
jgi:Carboxypeptidase regulatory-like domain